MGSGKKVKITVYKNTRVCIIVGNGSPDEQKTEVSAAAWSRRGSVAIGRDVFAPAARVDRRTPKPVARRAIPGIEGRPGQTGRLNREFCMGSNKHNDLGITGGLRHFNSATALFKLPAPRPGYAPLPDASLFRARHRT